MTKNRKATIAVPLVSLHAVRSQLALS